MPSRAAPASVAVLLALILAAPPAPAQDEDARLSLGSDSYLAGADIVADAPVAGDLFIAGAGVSATAPVAGSAHMAGRDVTLSAAVEGNLYAAGSSVTVDGPVSGNASLVGYRVAVEAPLGGNLRAAAQRVRIDAPVSGSALIGAERVDLDAAIAGDARIAAEEIDFGDGARIDGMLTVYSDRIDAADIPASVIPAERITIELPAEWEGAWDSGTGRELRREAIWGAVGAFLWGVALVAIASAILAALAPESLAAMRARILGRAGASLGFGFLAMSAALGACLLLAITGIGLLLVPLALAVTLLLWAAGYVVGAYAVGAGLWIGLRREAPFGILERGLAGALGAVIVGLVALIPIVGWLASILVMLAGAGALILGLFRPAFHADTGA
jgi:hypothetical protein